MERSSSTSVAAAAIGAHELGTDFVRIDEDVRRIRPYAHRVGVRMFEQQQVVLLGVRMQRPLEAERVVVIDPAQPASVQRHRPQSSAAQSRVSMMSRTRSMNAAA